MTPDPIKVTRRILIVDDEPHILRTLEDLLLAEGYLVSKASDGKKALQEARGSVPDIILLDVMMPKMNGFDVLKNLKKDKKTMDIPVIMLTVKSSNQDIEQGITLYAEKYITKPFDPDQLLQEIEKSFTIRFKSR